MLDEVAALIEREYFDEEFLADSWPAIRAGFADLHASAQTTAARESVVRDLLAALDVSHTLLITPAMKKEIEEKTADPRRLSMKLQRKDDALLARVCSFKVKTTRNEDLEELGRALKGVRHLILDLRLNDGGSGLVVAALAGFFLDSGVPVLRMRDRAGRRMEAPVAMPVLSEEENLDHKAEVEAIRRHHFVEYRTLDEPVARFDGQVTVLVGPRCYSCGEVFVQAMKEHSDARILGARTAGCVVGADTFDLSGGYAVLLPWADMESGRGVRLEGVGAEPGEPFDFGNRSDGEILAELS